MHATFYEKKLSQQLSKQPLFATVKKYVFIMSKKIGYFSLYIDNIIFIRNPRRDISFPIFIRKEIETRKLERKTKQKISRSIDLLYRLNDIIGRLNDIK